MHQEDELKTISTKILSNPNRNKPVSEFIDAVSRFESFILDLYANFTGPFDRACLNYLLNEKLGDINSKQESDNGQ